MEAFLRDRVEHLQGKAAHRPVREAVILAMAVAREVRETHAPHPFALVNQSLLMEVWNILSSLV
jgi:hypothetical protein